MQRTTTRRIRQVTGAAALLLGGSLLLAPQAFGYAIEVHKDFYDLAFGGRDAGRTVTPPSQDGLDAFRKFVYQRASQNAAFKKRWPTEASFDRAAFKEFLALNPGKPVVAIDTVPSDRPTDVRTVVREGSVDPDNDHRNQDRMFVKNGKVVLDAYGRAVPDDPRTVWFGGLTGTPSQFDAHGATLRSGKKGEGLMTALRNPSQFARPAVSLGSAPEFSEMYTQLAMIAKLWGGDGSEWLALSFAGNNMHGIEDLGNQIHTTLIGTWEFFLDAKWTFYKRKIKSAFKKKNKKNADKGFVAPESLTMAEINEAMAKIKVGKIDEVDPKVRFAIGKEPKGTPTDTEIGIRIIGNHHRLLEDFVQKQYLSNRGLANSEQVSQRLQAKPEVVELIRRARAGDKAFEKACRAALKTAGIDTKSKGQTPFAKVIAELMIESSAPEAQPIYRAIRKISKKELKREGTYDENLGHDVMDFVTKKTPKNKHVRKIWDLTGNAFARVVTALRLWDEMFEKETAGVRPGSPEALKRASGIIDRMVDRQVKYLEAKEARRAKYLAEKEAEVKKKAADAKAKKGLMSRIKGWFK